MCQSCRGAWDGEGFKLGKTLLRAGAAVEVSEQQSGGIHVGRLTGLRKISGAVGYRIQWDTLLSILLDIYIQFSSVQSLSHM